MNKVFQIIRDFVCKQEEQIHRGAFSCDNDIVWVVNSVTELQAYIIEVLTGERNNKCIHRPTYTDRPQTVTLDTREANKRFC